MYSSTTAKALELFMQVLVDETCKETRIRSAKKMTAVHLKICINKHQKFDFLKDIVAKVPMPDEEAGEAVESKK
ncbi:hypothetical protein HDV05_005278 [Chytridiales sp. JEL 0842]|nr:hypothetical protein HDV05_005278 [Chytridiales sp. JEL 0842]